MNKQLSYTGHVRAILTLGLPLIGSHLAQMAIGITDALMIGWYDVAALAALTLASSYFFIIFIAGSGFALAVMPIVAEAVGANDNVRTRRVTRMGLWISLLFAVLSMPLFIWSENLMLLLGQTKELSALSERYLIVAGIGLLPALMVMTFKSYLAALEHTSVLFWATIGAAVLNAFTNYLLIFGNWGFPELGIEGAAIASVLTQILSVALLFLYAWAKDTEQTLFKRIWRPDWVAFRQVLYLGLPISLTLLAEVGLFTASSIMVGWVGLNELAAHGIAIQLASIAFMVQLGLSGVGTIRAGNALGRHDIQGLRAGSRVLSLMSLAFAVVAVLTFAALPEFLVGLFLSPDDIARDEIIRIGTTLLGLAALFQLADGAQAIALGLLRGIQDTKIPMIIAAFSYWMIGAVLSYVLSVHFGFGAPGVWVGLATGLMVAAVLLNYRFWKIAGKDSI